VRPGSAIELRISDGLVEEFGGRYAKPAQRKTGAAKRVHQINQHGTLRRGGF